MTVYSNDLGAIGTQVKSAAFREVRGLCPNSARNAGRDGLRLNHAPLRRNQVVLEGGKVGCPFEITRIGNGKWVQKKLRSAIMSSERIPVPRAELPHPPR
jgi:hypothetical protein